MWYFVGGTVTLFLSVLRIMAGMDSLYLVSSRSQSGFVQVGVL